MIDRASEVPTGASPNKWRAAEYFAGIGLAGRGMEKAGIDVIWSNDISATKHALFELGLPAASKHQFVLGDLANLSPTELPRNIDLAWASFPCTDLSLAGGRAGLHRGTASSTFWHFVKTLSSLGSERPAVIALENVTAFATSHSGRDISSAIRSLNGLGYSIDVLNIDARHFVPQSRPRLFLVGSLKPIDSAHVDSVLRPSWLNGIFEDASLQTHRMPLPALPLALSEGLANSLEAMASDDQRWWSADRVQAYTESLSNLQRIRFDLLRSGDEVTFRTAYRRMRGGIPRWEMRNDGISGCLRTSSGGSSKQAVVALGHGETRIRWMTPREYATLMGTPTFPLDGVKQHHAYSGFGDAVCAPVVEWLSRHYLVPLLESSGVSQKAA